MCTCTIRECVRVNTSSAMAVALLSFDALVLEISLGLPSSCGTDGPCACLLQQTCFFLSCCDLSCLKYACRSLQDWKRMVGEEDSSDPLQLTFSRKSGLDTTKPKHGKVHMVGLLIVASMTQGDWHSQACVVYMSLIVHILQLLYIMFVRYLN